LLGLSSRGPRLAGGDENPTTTLERDRRTMAYPHPMEERLLCHAFRRNQGPAIAAIDAASKDYPFETDGAVVKVGRFCQTGKCWGSNSQVFRLGIAYKIRRPACHDHGARDQRRSAREPARSPRGQLGSVQLDGKHVVRRASPATNDDMSRRSVFGSAIRVVIETGREISEGGCGGVRTSLRSASRKPPPFEMPTTCPLFAALQCKRKTRVRSRVCPNARLVGIAIMKAARSTPRGRWFAAGHRKT